MLRIPFLVGTALVIIFLGGIYSAQWALDATRGFGGLQVNNWVAYPQIQTKDADPYARAHRANDGKILLGRAEGLVFRAQVDQNQEPLLRGCDYILKGRVPPALFWTLRTVHPENEPLNIATGWPSTINAQKVLRNGKGNIEIRLSQFPQSGNWLAVDPNKDFELQLTLIDTPISNVSGIRALEMPVIVKGECHNA
ncbi:MAG: DUF1214 domain-containing protein [Rhizobiaceae bacterium]|nr:DUF1214 domain-containing protein [Rhizobiaceae bacterium]